MYAYTAEASFYIFVWTSMSLPDMQAKACGADELVSTGSIFIRNLLFQHHPVQLSEFLWVIGT